MNCWPWWGVGLPAPPPAPPWNAHYTDPAYTDAIWTGSPTLGFTGGRCWNRAAAPVRSSPPPPPPRS